MFEIEPYHFEPSPMTEPASAALLDDSVTAFMRYFIAHINPILHRTRYGGRNFTEHEIIVTMALHVVGPSRPGDLSRGLSIEKATMTSVLRRLRDLQFIERRDIPGDERSYLVALAPAGRAFVRHLGDQRRRGFERLFAAMAPEDAAAAAKGLDLIAGCLKRMEAENGMGPQAPSRDP
jgi:DNA-binding MarR family transcriptional regulator